MFLLIEKGKLIYLASENITMKKTAVVTISSNNYFAQALTLLQSLKVTNVSWDRYYAIADNPDDDVVESLKKENVSLIKLSELNIPDLKDMEFRYSIVEFNTAIKPFVLLKLLDTYDNVVYIDPDVYVYNELSEVNEAFKNGYDFVMTPHFTRYFDEDEYRPRESDILQVGTYNLGFFGVANSEDGIKALKWWAKKLEKMCVDKKQEGIFVDQRWMDLIPCRHKKTYILRSEGYNVAPWNLNHRIVRRKNGKMLVNNDELVFFHFSNLNPHDIGGVCQAQNRYRLNDLGEERSLYSQYADEVILNQYDMWRAKKYSFSQFSDGRPIKNIFRIIYRDNPLIKKKLGEEDPFSAAELFYNKEFITPFIIDQFTAVHNELSHYLLNWNEKTTLAWIRFVLREEYDLDEEWIEYIVLSMFSHSYHNSTKRKMLISSNTLAIIGKRYPLLLKLYRKRPRKKVERHID